MDGHLELSAAIPFPLRIADLVCHCHLIAFRDQRVARIEIGTLGARAGAADPAPADLLEFLRREGAKSLPVQAQLFHVLFLEHGRSPPSRESVTIGLNRALGARHWGIALRIIRIAGRQQRTLGARASTANPPASYSLELCCCEG